MSEHGDLTVRDRLIFWRVTLVAVLASSGVSVAVGYWFFAVGFPGWVAYPAGWVAGVGTLRAGSDRLAVVATRRRQALNATYADARKMEEAELVELQRINRGLAAQKAEARAMFVAALVGGGVPIDVAHQVADRLNEEAELAAEERYMDESLGLIERWANVGGNERSEKDS